MELIELKRTEGKKPHSKKKSFIFEQFLSSIAGDKILLIDLYHLLDQFWGETGVYA